jgi:hypothetical protein
MALYYDNDTTSRPESGESVPVERVYCLRLNDFEAKQWEQLMRIYESLPGWVGVGEHGCPAWFSKSEQPPFLLASVEPSGLLVTGSLTPHAWQAWHEAFAPVLSRLPNFEV